MRRKPELVSTTELCSYGCGNTAQYKNNSNRLMCETSANKCLANKLKNSSGVRKTYLEGSRPPSRHLYISLPQSSKDKMAWNRGLRSADFSYGGRGNHKAVLITERGHQCESCRLTEWLGDEIPLELEHCDGNNKNNSRENLLLLCPNCHAKTVYYRRKNIPNQGKKKVEDVQIIEQIKKGLNNRQVLLAVGLTPKGGNYERVNGLRATLK